MLEKKRYYFYVITGVYPKNFRSIDFSRYDIVCQQLHSLAFGKTIKQLSNMDNMLEELISETKRSLKKITFVLYSTNEENLEKLFHFLIMLQPSKLSLMSSFESHYDSYEIDGNQVEEHRIEGLSLYDYSVTHFIISFTEDKKKRLFALMKGEAQRANKLLSIYMTTKHPESFKKLMGIYYESYSEEKDYVKYLLLMMFIESLVNDDDFAGVTYKLARICAVLVGDNRDSSNDIFDKMKKAYRVRSRLVHSATSTVHEGNYLLFVQSIVCELVATIILNGLEIEELFSKSTQMGFGDRSMIWEKSNLRNMSNFWMNEMNFIVDLKEEKQPTTSKAKGKKQKLKMNKH